MKLFFAVLIICFTSLAQADWQLNTVDSRLYFSSIKKNSVYETHQFNTLQGNIDAAGNALLVIDLNSVSTGISIRDDRIKSMLFKTDQFPSAQFKVSIAKSKLHALEQGKVESVPIEGELSLFGTQKSVAAALRVIKLSAAKILIATDKPILIKAADYSLSSGVDALQKIANLPSISHTVAVHFSLLFDRVQ